jgi:hypothetical protein
MGRRFPELWVMFHPGAAYKELSEESGPVHWWRRPLLSAFVIGCMVSLMTSARLTVRLAGPASIYWTFVPACEIAGLAAGWRGRPRTISFSRAVDLFFLSNTPLFLALAGYTGLFAFAAPDRAFAWTNDGWLGNGIVVLMLLWAAYLDYCFFRVVLRRSPWSARADLVIQRLVSWGGVLLIFLSPYTRPL